MGWWEIDSELRVETSSGVSTQALDEFAIRCYRELTAAGATDPVISGDPSEGTLRTSFLLNTVKRPEHANTQALQILSKATEALDDADWKVIASTVSVQPAE